MPWQYTINVNITAPVNSATEGRIANMLEHEEQQKKEEGEKKEEPKKEEPKKKKKEVDDFWSNGGKTEKTENNNTLKDGFWKNGGNRGSKSGQSKDDGFWKNGGETDGGENDDFWTGVGGDANGTTAFEIVERDGKQGVIGANGKVLIPFKEWEIKTYNDGLAEVEMYLGFYEHYYASHESGSSPYSGISACDLEEYYVTVGERRFISGYINSSGEWINEPERIIERDVYLGMWQRLYYVDPEREHQAGKRCHELVIKRAKNLAVSPGFTLKVIKIGLWKEDNSF